MGDKMVEKVARAYAPELWPPEDTDVWTRAQALTVEASRARADVLRRTRAALEASHHEELVTALKVYANPDHWQEMTGEFLVRETDDDDRIVWDSGELARAVLAKLEASHA